MGHQLHSILTAWGIRRQTFQLDQQTFRQMTRANPHRLQPLNMFQHHQHFIVFDAVFILHRIEQMLDRSSNLADIAFQKALIIQRINNAVSNQLVNFRKMQQVNLLQHMFF